MIRYRWAALVVWLVVLLAGGWSSSRLSALLSNTFTVPGTDSERARTILQDHFGDRSDGSFLLVFRVPDSRHPALRMRLQRSVDAAVRKLPTGQPRRLVVGGPRVLYADVASTLK